MGIRSEGGAAAAGAAARRNNAAIFLVPLEISVHYMSQDVKTMR